MILLLLTQPGSCDRQPQPGCHSNDLAPLYPITLGESLFYPIENEFKGYNLEFSVAKDDSESVFVTKDKLRVIGTAEKALTGIRSLHVDHIGNAWGENFQVLTEEDGTTKVQLGKLINGAPVVNHEVLIENLLSQICYDTVWFEDVGLLLVDCAVRMKEPDDEGFSFRNIFYYVDTRTSERLKRTVETPLYVPFRNILQRKVANYTDPATNMRYLIRTYLEEGVDPSSRDNTYLEVFSMDDVYNPWIVKVIDRSFVGSDSMAIADVKIYKGDVYLLDVKKGLYRFDFTRGLDIVVTGHYAADQQLTKLAVYQSTLDGIEYVALANAHAVYEIDWTFPARPKEVAKYSLLNGSLVTSLWLNEDFLVVQATANVTFGTSFMLNNYTWVMNRGDRTYSTAFKVIDHQHWRAFTHFDRRDNRLMVADQNGITTYQLTVPYLSIVASNPGNLNQSFTVIVEARSHDPYGEDFTCSIRLNLTFTDPADKTVYVTPDKVSARYYTVFPGKASIPLYDYAIGPNITYEVEHPDPALAPETVVLQQNSSRLTWKEVPSNIVFYRQFEHFENFSSVVVAQDGADLSLHVADCFHSDPEYQQFSCRTIDVQRIGSPILNMSIYQEAETHMLAILVKRTVLLINTRTHTTEWQKTYPDDFSGAVSDVTLSEECVFVTLKYAKEVVCHSRRSRFDGFKIDSMAAADLGIDYWSPLSVAFSRFHPRLLFVSTYDTVYVIDHGTDHVIRVLSNITNSKALSRPFFKVSLNSDFLVVLQLPNIIEEYSLSAVYKGSTPFLKTYPMYGYVLPPGFNVTFARFTDLLFVEAVEEQAGRSTILVFVPGRLAHAVLYDVINLPQRYDQLFMDTSGFLCNYVGIVANGKLSITRQFDYPILVLESILDHNFTLSLHSSPEQPHTFQVQLKVASIPVKLTGNRSIVKEADLSRGKEQFFSDRGWVNGSVTGYRCLNCGRKLSLRGHVWERAEVVSAVGMYDYCDSAGGGYVTGIDHLFQLHHNGSLRQVHDYPSHAPFEACTRVTSDVLDLYTVTACENSGNVNLYLTSYAGRSGFTMGPFESQALEARKLQSTGRVIMLADVSRYPQFRFRTGAVHLFDVSTDPDGPILEELEVIDSNDLQGTQGWDQDLAFFGNADLSFTEQTDTYRLLVTELDSGLFTVHFTYHRGSKEISVRQTSFLDVNRLLAKHNYSMPFNSHFAAVRVVGFEYDAFWDYEEVQVLVTTNNFHSFVLNITYDSHGVQIEAALTRVLLKYGYYNTNNYVKALDGLVALGLTLPQEFHWIDYLPKQQLVIFDVRRHQNETWNSPPAELHFIGSTRSNSTFEFTFDFNFTVNRHNETFEVVDLGLLAVDPMGLYLREYRVSRNLSLIKQRKVNSVNLQFVVINDYSNYSDSLMLISDDYLEWYEIVLIVLFSLGTVAAVGFLGLTVLRMKRGEIMSREESPVTISMQSSPLLQNNEDLAEQEIEH